MTIIHKKEVINVIIAMWLGVTLKPEEKFKFQKKLQNSSDYQLATIYFDYLDIYKKMEIKRNENMYLSASAFQEIKEISYKYKKHTKEMSEKKYTPGSKEANISTRDEIDQSLIEELSSFTIGDLETNKKDPSFSKEPFYDISKILCVSSQKLDEILAVTYYYLMIKARQEAETIFLIKKELDETSLENVTKRIEKWFTANEFFGILSQYNWLENFEHQPSEQNLEIIKKHLIMYINFKLTESSIRRK